MKMKLCPYCGKEISGEAVLCKYCHNLLIGDDESIADHVPEEEQDDGRTRVFTKEEMNAFDDKTRAFVMPENVTAGVIEDKPAPGTQQDNFSDRGYIPTDNYDDDSYEEEYEDDYDDDTSDSDADAKKRLFVITACITIGILVIIIAAIFVGMKLFGVKGGDNSSKNASQTRKISAKADDDTSESAADVINSVISDDTSSTVKTESSSTADSSAAEVTSSEADSSSKADDSSSKTETSSETTTTTSVTESTASSTTSTTTSATSASNGSVDESTVLAAASSQIDGNVTSSEFRVDDGNFVYYYFYTDNGHGYSVAYNKGSGSAIVVQNY